MTTSVWRVHGIRIWHSCQNSTRKHPKVGVLGKSVPYQCRLSFLLSNLLHLHLSGSKQQYLTLAADFIHESVEEPIRFVRSVQYGEGGIIYV